MRDRTQSYALCVVAISDPLPRLSARSKGFLRPQMPRLPTDDPLDALMMAATTT
jgi:hypothetical protein